MSTYIQRSRLGLALVALVSVVALSAAASMAFARPAKHRAAMTVNAMNSTQLHRTILVAGRKGMTLYYLKGESATHIKCTGSCATLWPPLLVKSSHVKLKGGHGVHGRLTIVHRPGGQLQAAFDGLPLYYYAGDHSRGDVNGQGVGNVWFVLPAAKASAKHPRPNGNPPPSNGGGAPGGGY